MCETLKRIRGCSAEEILVMANQKNSIPVDLDAIVKYLKIKYIPTDFSDIEKKEQKKVYGLVLLNNTEIGIFYREGDSIEQKRYVISHEIGHCCLHDEKLSNGYIEFLADDGENKEEEEYADVFAMNLLMPEESIKSVHLKLIKPSIKSIAKIFQVPVELAKKRLESLKIIYYDDEKNEMVVPN